MSQSAVGGRESRLAAPVGTKSAGESSVTVKIVPHLPNSSTGHGRKAGKSSNAENRPNNSESGSKSVKSEKVTTAILQKSTKASVSANGQLKEKSASNPNTGLAKARESSGSLKSTDERNGTDMRTNYRERDQKPRHNNKSSRPISAKYGNSQSGGVSSSRGGRVFTPSEKGRSTGATVITTNRGQDSIDMYQRSIVDGSLCKLLTNVAKNEDNKNAAYHIDQLLTYITDGSNSRSILKVGQALWEALLELCTSSQRSLRSNTSHASLMDCLICSGTLSRESSGRARFIDWIFFNYNSASSSDDARIILMKVMNHVLKLGVVSSSMTQSLIEKLQNALENAESTGVLVSVLENILYFSANNSNAFAPVFVDVVDILIGWFLELGESDSLLTQLTDALISLHEYWKVNVHWCKTLTGQFLDDAEGYCEEIITLSPGSPKSETAVEKVVLLFRVFHTLVKASGEYFSREKTATIEQGYIIKCVERILSCYETLTNKKFSPPLRLIVDRCILVLAACGEDISSVPALSTYLSAHIGESLLTDNYQEQVCFLRMLSTVVKTGDAALLSDILESLLSSDLTVIYTSDSYDVQQSAMMLYHNLFSLKDMKIVQFAYKQVRESITDSLSLLSSDVEMTWSDTRADIQRKREVAVDLILFNLSTLTQVVTDTSSIILMYALKPSVFNLLLREMIMDCGESIKSYPHLLVAILRILILHSSCNKHFITKSDLCAAETRRPVLLNIPVNKNNSDNFSQILESVGHILSISKSNSKALNLVTEWMDDVLKQVVALNPPLIKNNLVTAAVTHILNADCCQYPESALLHISECVITLLQSGLISVSFQSVLLDFTVYQLSNESDHICKVYLNTLCYFPGSSILRFGKTEQKTKRYDQVLSQRRAVMSGSYGSLNADGFRLVANILFKQLTDEYDIKLAEIQTLLLCAEKASVAPNQIMYHRGLLEHWCLWQTADFCVAHRLRTPIGKPVDTFMCIEAAIKQIAADVTSNENASKSEASPRRVWLLLQFLEDLEKALYNAYEGTAGHMASQNKTVKTFFRTNKGTCIEWLTRIRLHVLSIASSFSHPTTVIRHGYELLTDMVKNQSTQTPEFELVLVYLAGAWCHLKSYESIQGLYEWTKQICNRKLPWLKSVIPKAMQRYELAASELRASLVQMVSPQTHSSGDSIQLQTRPQQLLPAVSQFCMQHITNCYTKLLFWDEASNWLSDFEQMQQDNSGIADVDPISATDKILLNRSLELTKWSRDQELTSLLKPTGSPGQLSHLSEDACRRLESLALLETCSDWPPSLHSDTLLSLQSQSVTASSDLLSQLSMSQSHDVSLLLNINNITTEQGQPDPVIVLACCREARKSGNLLTAKRLINSLSHQSDSMLRLKIARESAKLLYSDTDSQKSALSHMVDAACYSASLNNDDKHLSELVARSVLTTVKWLQSDSKLLSEMIDEDVDHVSDPGLAKLVSNCGLLITESAAVPYPEKVIGSLLSMSTAQCHDLAKTWYTYGNWAYKWGRKCLDSTEQILSDEDREQVENLLPSGISAQEVSDIMAVMNTVQGSLTPTDEDLTEDSPDYEDEDVTEIRKRLSSCSELLTEDILDGLVQLWLLTAKQVYNLYEESARAYFSYLNLGSSGQTSGYNNVTVTLRLLRLLVKHAWELRSVLENGLMNTPTSPWKNIIPQLFSRLTHPEQYVRQSVSELLCRLAEYYPHLIVYPAIVAWKQATHSSSKVVSLMDSRDADDESTDATKSSENKYASSDCFKLLIDTLAKNNPLLITQVDTLVTELCRITVLWDELWLGSLAQLNNTAAEKIKSLSAEVERVKTNTSLSSDEKMLLIKEKRQMMVKPLVHAIDRLRDITNQPAETQHEQWFQDSYGAQIESGFRKISNPAKDEDLQSDWQPFKQAYIELQKRSMKRPSHMLKMKDVSGALSSLNDTWIPLPGILARGDSHPVTLQAVLPSIQILPTKTKPKKLAFLGSDGQKYMYLFKGLEDLHLDERIMQLLSIVNNMLEPRSKDRNSAFYRARNYSVTPLGLRSGLIQWVDGCVPLFSLYKRWQVREANASQTKSGGPTSTVQRPSEVFYSKLIPLLRHALDNKSLKDMKDVEKIRKEWPIATLMAASKQLIAETPSQLVSREIWCSSTSTIEWWDMTQTYCRSVAVMSAIGYILGLGDRHLDNLLLDLNNGEVVHIDYNVCFDKGKSLRVPERIPFRLTQNIVAAMGATGIEGIFRSACEHTIKVMRLGKETLLTLLEAFVYDPLVDWTVGGESGLAGAFFGGNYALGDAAKDHRRRKRQMERDITRSMFSIRVTEMKTAWLQNKDDMVVSLKEMMAKLSDITDDSSKVESFYKQTEQCDGLIIYLNDMKCDGVRAVSDLLQRYETNQKYLIVKGECLSELERFVDELSQRSRLHQIAVEGLTSSHLEKLIGEMRHLPKLGTSPSSCTKSFLQSVGQASQLDQLEIYHQQVTELSDTRQAVITKCFELLSQYASVVRQFPVISYTTGHAMGDCALQLDYLKQDFSATSCEVVRTALESNSRSSPPQKITARVLSNEKILENSLNADLQKLDKVVKRSSAEDLRMEDLSLQLEQKKASMSSFLQNYGESGFYCLLVVIIPKLVEVNKRCLLMEGTASRAGDRLHCLTTREGDWFLDELTSITENLLEYVTMIKPRLTQTTNDHSDKPSESSDIPVLYNCISGVHHVYSSLQDMIQNFQQIILPGVLASISREDKNALTILNSLTLLVNETHDLKNITAQLETSLRNIIFGTKEVDENLSNSVRNLRQSYQCLLSPAADSHSDSHMLLVAFDGLFSHVFTQYQSAVIGLSQLNIPKNWRKVDMVREAGDLRLTQYSERTEQLLSDLFFVRQLKAISEFYSAAKDYSTLFKDVDQVEVMSYEVLSLSIRKFVAEFIRNQLVGSASLSVGYLICGLLSRVGLQVEKEIELKDFGANSKVAIDDLCKKGLNGADNGGQGEVSLVNALLSNYDSVWKRYNLSKRLSQREIQLRSLVSQQQHHLICYQWYHEHTLKSVNSLSGKNSASNRKVLLTELLKCHNELLATDAVFHELTDKLLASESSIAQRLKWAAGANPQLQSVMTTFENAQAHRSNYIQAENMIVKELTTYSSSILHLETMRAQTHESATVVSKSMELVDRCLDVCRLLGDSETVTDDEKLLISLMSKSDRQKSGEAFLGKARELVSSHKASLAAKIRGLVKSSKQLQEKYNNHVSHLQYSILNAHHKLISEVRAVLKTLAKEEAEERDLGSVIQVYLADYKQFSERLALLLRSATEADFSNTSASQIISLITDLLQSVESIFTRLIDIARPLTGQHNQDSSPTAVSSVLAASPNSAVSPSAVKPTSAANSTDKVFRDPKTGKAVQERNSYAVSVWRRVKMKLDGRELDPNKKMSVTDQCLKMMRSCPIHLARFTTGNSLSPANQPGGKSAESH